jgi:hypothetical protein
VVDEAWPVALGAEICDGSAVGADDPSGRSDEGGAVDAPGPAVGLAPAITLTVGPARLGLGPLAGTAENCVSQVPVGSRLLPVHVPSIFVPLVSDRPTTPPATVTDTDLAIVPAWLR